MECTMFGKTFGKNVQFEIALLNLVLLFHTQGTLLKTEIMEILQKKFYFECN